MNPFYGTREDEIIRNPSFISTHSIHSNNNSDSASSIINESLSTCSQDSSYSSQCFGSPGDENDDKITIKNLDSSYVPLRYRGFTSSISHLFLDETLVCTSISCFGMLLSLRTEHLLGVRNARMGIGSGRGRKRSWIMGISFLVMIVFIMLTYLFWGRESTNFYNSTNNNMYSSSSLSISSFSSSSGSSSSISNDVINNNDRGLLLENDNTTSYHYDDNNNKGIGMIYYWHTTFTNIFNNLLQTSNVWKDLQNINNNNSTDTNTIVRNLSNNNSSGLTWHNGTRIIILIIFLLFLGTVGRRRRMRTRYKLLQARAQDDLHVWISNWRVRKILSNKVVDEGTCTHLLCGCYGIDIPQQNNKDTTLLNSNDNKDDNDLCQFIFKHVNACFCGILCKCWIQLCSICALAQEAREVKTLLPMRYQQVDYITHESFESYHKRMVILRQEVLSSNNNDYNNNKSSSSSSSSSISLMAHFRGFSHLTQYILLTFFFLIILVIATLQLNPSQTSSFGLHNILLLCATFGVSFMLLFVAHWLFHKSDLTLDAVIKFYAAGFLIAAPTAMILESIVVGLSLFVSYIVYGICIILHLDTVINFLMDYYFYIWIIVEILYCYIVVALIEELCKYYVFRAVEHPDLIFLTDLLSRTLDMEISWDRKYRKNKRRNRKNNDYDDNSNHGQQNNNNDDNDDDDPPESRNVRQMAAAITVAMISVAVGLACAENFCYVFFISGLTSTKEKFALLIIRSIFPMHALCTAMQSISVIWRFIIHLNNNNTISDNNEVGGQLQRNNDNNTNNKIGVGKIITSSVLFHGTFDAILFLLNVYTMYYQMNVAITLLSWILVSGFFTLGLCHYYSQNRNLREHLIDIVLSEANRKLEVKLQQFSRTRISSGQDVVDHNDEDEDEDGDLSYRNIVSSPSEITMDDNNTATTNNNSVDDNTNGGDGAASTTFSLESKTVPKLPINDKLSLQEEYHIQRNLSSSLSPDNDNNSISKNDNQELISKEEYQNMNIQSSSSRPNNKSFIEQEQKQKQRQEKPSKRSSLLQTENNEAQTITSTATASTKGSLLFKSWLPFRNNNNHSKKTKIKKMKKNSKIKVDDDDNNNDDIGSYKNPDLIPSQKQKDDNNVWV